MTSKERILRVLNHKIPDRVPVHDSVWSATAGRWHREGMPQDMSPEEYFGYEIRNFGCDQTPRFPVKEVEKTEEFIITTTPFGGTRKNHRDYSTTPEIIDWPIKTKEDWKEIKKRLLPDMSRVDWASGLQANMSANHAGKFTCYSCVTGYDALQNYMKSEQILISMAEDPGWIKDMIMTITELSIVMADLMIKNGYRFDGMFTYNDMGYRNGLLFSPDTYRKTHYEADRLLYGYFHSKGMKNILHSCGNVTELIPLLIEVGLDCLQPIEVKAGMDIISLKENFGDRLSFMGGIDVRLMAEAGPEAIEEEIRIKFEAAKKNGGYIYHSDHSIPKNVSFSQYCRVIELVKKYGQYPEFEEIMKNEAVSEPPAESREARKGKAGRKRKEEATAPDAPKGAPAEENPKPVKKSGLFGRKQGEKDAPVKKPEPEKEVKAESGEGRKMRLPFGRKK